MKELDEKAKLKAGDSVIVGCSTSQIIGSKIGTNSSPDVAVIVFEVIYKYAKKMGWHLAFQCCEHLKRAIVVQKRYHINGRGCQRGPSTQGKRFDGNTGVSAF